MKQKWMNTTTDELFEAIVKLENLDETRRFFRDLLTEPEILELANRWRVAQMLDKGIPYSDIEQATGMSSTTIARVSQWLNRGMGGYKLMLKRTNTMNRVPTDVKNHHHHAQAQALESG
jgi:TrpR-related protein YerC/YecD